MSHSADNTTDTPIDELHEVVDLLADAGTATDGPAFRCPDCNGGFDEPVPVHGEDDRYRTGVIAHQCPFCGTELTTLFTQLQNVRSCSHTATSDIHGSTVHEVCQSCGAKFGPHGLAGIKPEWALPAENW